MSESQEENSSKKSQESKKDKSSQNEEEEPINIEEEISEDKYQIQSSQNSNILSNKLIQLLQECLLAPVNKFNKDIFYKCDKEKLLDKESLDLIDIDLNNFKISYIEEQYKIIKELISKYDLIGNLKEFSDEKIFAQELNNYNINADLFSFIGPLSNKINEVNIKGENDNSIEIDQFLFKILEMNYYNQKTALIEERIKMLDTQIEDLKNKNKIL